MKAIIVLCLVLALAYTAPINAYEENKQIKFEYDVHEGSPVGLYLEGLLDPRNESVNKIQTFLKLANKYIPILESLGENQGELKWDRTWHVEFLGVNVQVFAYFQLIVGWRVQPGGYTTDRFDVVYTPFVWGGAYGSVNGTTWPARGSADAGIQYIYTYAPIQVNLFKAGKICFQGSYYVEPVAARTHLFAALNECRDEIFGDLIDGRDIFVWECNYTNPVNITLIDKNFTDRFVGDFIPQTCFEF